MGNFPNILWIRLYTDEGLVGLGETFMGAQAVEAYLHEWAAPRLIGKDPLATEARNTDLLGYLGYLGWRGSGVGWQKPRQRFTPVGTKNGSLSCPWCAMSRSAWATSRVWSWSCCPICICVRMQ